MADDRRDEALAAIEARLAGYPDPAFRARLRQRLERSTRMTATIQASALIPYIVAQDIEPVIAFAKSVFGAEEVMRGVGSAGGIHCELRIGDSRVMMGGALPTTPKPIEAKLVALHVYVPDVDAAYARAIAAGATSLGAPADAHYGERAGYVKDVAGNHWYIATHTGPSYFKDPATVTPSLIVQYKPGHGASAFIDFAEAAFGAEVEMQARAEGSDRVKHAVLRIGAAALELGESETGYFDASSMFILNVSDCDAAYERAIAAGATSIAAPAAQKFGGRMGGVADPWGNQWYLASE